MMLFDRLSFYNALQVIDFKHIFKIIHPMKTYCNTLEGCCSIQLSYGQVKKSSGEKLPHMKKPT
jgi:hypothetical protein